MQTATDAALTAQVMAALARVIDPESGLNLVDMGLVVGVDVATRPICVQLTMTSAACPMSESILDDALKELDAELAPEHLAEVDLVWDPPWHPSRMSEHGKQEMGWDPSMDDEDQR